MLLSRITIEKLFGTFDYRIELKPDGLTVLIGPNGYGKTTILRMIDAFAEKRILFFVGLNFKRITFGFNDERTIVIEKITDTKLRFIIDNEERDIDAEPIIESVIDDSKLAVTIGIGPFDIGSQRAANIKDILESIIPFKNTRYSIPNDVKDFFNFQFPDVYFIREQRLWRKIGNGNTSNGTNPSLGNPTYFIKPVYEENIEQYAKALKEIMGLVDSEYAEKTRELDSSYLRRFFESKDNISEEEFRKRFERIQKLQRSLNAYGLSVTQEDPPSAFDPGNAKTLSVYLNDMEEKLNVFDELLKALDLFTEILNSRRFVNKRICVSKEDGLKFVANDGTPLKLGDLSSGEQHEIAILFNMLFQAKPNTLVLIDEPEISLHIAWQKAFLSDLFRIIQLRKISVIVATHSPQIIADYWDNVVDLVHHGGTVDE